MSCEVASTEPRAQATGQATATLRDFLDWEPQRVPGCADHADPSLALRAQLLPSGYYESGLLSVQRL